MEKFTLVIPTMWRYQPFVKFLSDLIESEWVDEIVIVNNDNKNTPDSPILSHGKIKMFDFGTNVYVNPVFNLGVKLSRNNFVCLLNDDIVFDFKMFHHVARVLSPTTGVVGICPGLDEFKQPPFTSGTIEIVPWQGQHTFGFGCLMFIHKQAWIPIPEEFKLYYGDNWIFDTALARGMTNYLITDALFFTPYAQTCKDLAVKGSLLQSEGHAFRVAMDGFRRDILAKKSVS